VEQGVRLALAQPSATGPLHAPPAWRQGFAQAAGSAAVFIFFSNKLGCLGSILVSLLGTAVVLGLIWLL